jgi:hypothetical protein
MFEAPKGPWEFSVDAGTFHELYGLDILEAI